MLRNKRALITGSTSGIGHEVARGLARQNFDLILLGRDEAKLQPMIAELTALATKKITVDYFVCDFEKLSHVSAISKLIGDAYRELDVLVNNAGMWETKYRKDEHNWEMTWVVNYFASFILTNNLLPILRLTALETHDVRIINTASDAHKFGKIKFPLAENFHFYISYGSTKLANILHANYLASSLKEEGIYANSVHPGVVATGLWNRLPAFIVKASKKFMVTAEDGAKTTISLAAAPELNVTGRYFEKMKSAVPSKSASDLELMVALYEETHRILNEFLIA